MLRFRPKGEDNGISLGRDHASILEYGRSFRHRRRWGDRRHLLLSEINGRESFPKLVSYHFANNFYLQSGDELIRRKADFVLLKNHLFSSIIEVSMFKKQQSSDAWRYRVLSLFFLVLALIVISRLFILQILQHDYYALFALNTHEIYKQIHPERGEIFFSSAVDGKAYPAAINKEFELIYAVPKEIPAGYAESTTAKLAEILNLDDTQKKTLLARLSASEASYRPVAKKIPVEVAEQIENENLKGIYFTPEEYRYYPEDNLGSTVLGFTSINERGELKGQYGLEGYFDNILSGHPGFAIGEKSAQGSWIALAGRTNIEAENGPDIYLTIDRALENQACARLKQGMDEYKAKSAALILMNPKTGAILAMCSLPDFDPNNYSKTENISAFNNTAVFTPYEPGSVFKSITMAAGLDLGLVSPNTTYVDPCVLNVDGFKIRNAQLKCYGKRTMTEVLENSINTGAAWVEEKVGNEKFNSYVQKFGFGDPLGITLNSEIGGDISELSKKGRVYGAVGSFGQGLTATPLQIAAAYSAIANGGNLMKPYVVDEVKHENGQTEKTAPQVVNRVISESASKLLSGMLVSVVENHYHAAKIDHYFIAGKTGTAQIPENGKYSVNRTNHTFAGFGPGADPKFVLVVKYEEPERQWAEQTALPVFRDVMKFALDYYAVPGDKP